MNVDLSLAEIKAVAAVLEPAVDGDSRVMTAWLKLVRAQAEGLAVPAKVASTPAVGTTNKVVPAPMPGVTRMGAGTVSTFDTWGLR